MSRLACLLLVLACESGQGASKAEAPSASLPPTAAEPDQSSGADSTPTPPSEGKPERGHGLAFRSASAATSTVEIAALGQLIVAQERALTLDLEDGTRVVAAPHTRLCALTFAPSLVLVSGQLRVTRPPEAARAGAIATRIATLAGAFESGPGTDATLRVEVARAARRKHGATDAPKLWELRAQAQLERGGLRWLALDERSQLREEQLIAGAGLPRASAGLHWLGHGQAETAFETAFRKLSWTKQPSQEDADRALELALSEQQALRDHGHELLASVSPRHAALAKLARDGSTQTSAKPAASTREYQRALVEQAQRSHSHAARLLLAAERSLLQALMACAENASGNCPAALAWAQRFSARCASLL